MAGEADSPLALENAAAEPAPALFPAASLAGAAALLASCGGGGGSGGGSESSASPAPPASPAPAPPTVALPTRLQASRFLGQVAMGASRADVDRVASVGFDAWLESQFNMPRETSHWDWLVANGYTASANVNSQAGFDPVMWRQLIASPDQLRQRVTMALLDILVVGIDGFNSGWRQFAMAAYVDLLADNAFGNFRTLLQQVSHSAAMGYYLTFINSRKANPTTGAVPDENYARELMQLFTIGLLRLNPDGTVQTSNGQPIETYTQADITGLARVFTGFVLDSTDNSTPDRLRRPMAIDGRFHETGAKTFLGTTIPAGTGGADSLKIALDTIFAHSNVAPFISKQLIQRLVTSNPSPAYVTRISGVFENNGSGVRGDLRAVVRAILLDFEARSDVATPSFGKLRAPVQRLTGWARAFGATSPSNAWPIGTRPRPPIASARARAGAPASSTSSAPATRRPTAPSPMPASSRPSSRSRTSPRSSPTSITWRG